MPIYRFYRWAALGSILVNLLPLATAGADGPSSGRHRGVRVEKIATCAEDLAARAFIPFAQTKLSGAEENFHLPSLFGGQDFSLKLIAGVQKGNLLNRRAFETGRDGGTRVALITAAELQARGLKRPPFGAMFLPPQNMIIVCEEPEGLRISSFEHEIAHLDFDRRTRLGEVTVFAGRATQTFEEIYTYAAGLAFDSPERRLKSMDYFEEHVMIPRPLQYGDTASHAPDEAFKDIADIMRSLLQENKSMSRYYATQRVATSFYPWVQPQGWGVEFYTLDGRMETVAHHVKIHDRSFIAVTLNVKNTFPNVYYFASNDAALTLKQLRDENISDLKTPRPHILALQAAILARSERLIELSNFVRNSFAKVRAEIHSGGSGDHAMAEMLPVLESYRQRIEPSL